MKILSNLLLVKVDPTDRIVLSNGFELYFDTRFEEQKAAPQTGMVLAVPERLRFSSDMTKPSIMYDTDMEVQVGDRIIFNFNAVDHATRTGLTFGSDFFISYDQCYIAIREDDEVVCLNGSVIVEPLEDEVESTLVIPGTARKKLKTHGIVRYASSNPVRQLRSNPMVNTTACPMSTDGHGFRELGRYVEPGDVIQFHFSNAIPLQHYHELHGAVSKKLLYRMQHHDIDLVIEPVNADA